MLDFIQLIIILGIIYVMLGMLAHFILMWRGQTAFQIRARHGSDHRRAAWAEAFNYLLMWPVHLFFWIAVRTLYGSRKDR